MLCKVISTKTVYGDKERILSTVMEDKEREHFLYRVLGVIDGYILGKGRHKRVDRDTGAAVDTFWTKFSGEFHAINADQRTFEAVTCFLPEYISGPFTTALQSDDRAEIEFAFDIFARYSKDSITSYEFVAMPVRQKGEEKSKAVAMLENLAAIPGAGAKQIEHKKK